MKKVLIWTLFLFGMAAAQTLTGIPVEWEPVVTVLVGLVAALLVEPVTAIAKKLGCTEGPTTVVISAGLSVVVALGFTFAQAVATRGELSWGESLTIALVAFIRSNGVYLSRMFSTAKGSRAEPGAAAAPVVIGELNPPAGLSVPPSGVEPLPFAGVPAVATGLLSNLIADVLREARLLATPEQVMRVALALAPVAPDLLDGDVHLSAQNRNRVLGVVLDLKTGGTL